MRYQVRGGACYLTGGPDHNMTLFQREVLPQSRFIQTQTFIQTHKANHTLKAADIILKGHMDQIISEESQIDYWR